MSQIVGSYVVVTYTFILPNYSTQLYSLPKENICL